MPKFSAVILSLIASTSALAQSSQLTVGPATLLAIVSSQLFTKQGRWYLLDDGPCYAYLESPHVRLGHGRLYLDAHLSSRVGAQFAGTCLGAGFASDVTLSGKPIGTGSTLTLDDVRIDRVVDQSTAD